MNEEEINLINILLSSYQKSLNLILLNLYDANK